ncbi:MAG: hypothetical protein OCD76_01810 [Reichenbachiella sp.]
MMSKNRYIIVFWLVLMLAMIYIIDISLNEDTQMAVVSSSKLNASITTLPQEEGVFKRSYDITSNQPTAIDPEIERTLTTYYNNRAYAGAPPTIPHEILKETGIGGKDCLQCHENGGYVARFDAFTPITPHPEYSNCKQCHVPSQTSKNYVATNWHGAKPPTLHNSALVTSPPVIPHDLQYRANCLACHAGAAAPKEIRVSHPERSNCRQCHVPATTLSGLQKNMKGDIEAGSWTRTTTE